MSGNPSREFWEGKRVLVTGHTGFKGAWLCLWLLELGAEPMGYSLDPDSEEGTFAACGLAERMADVRGNILDQDRLETAVEEFRPEVTFHLAAQPLVRRSYAQPKLTFETNVMGTLNVLEAMRRAGSVRSAVMITTDKCYENTGSARGYRESDPMGGCDPYSASKGCAELLIASYRNSFLSPGADGPAVASARAGNVIGGGDWAEDRLVPDCIRAIRRGEPVELRNPRAIRPWQFVLEPLCGYLMLAEKLWREPERFCGGWNFGPEPGQTATVEEVARRVAAACGAGTVQSGGVARPDEVIRLCDDAGGDGHGGGGCRLHEAQILCLDSSKAREELGWVPRLTPEETVGWTAEWYRDYRRKNPHEICLRQIREFERMEHP